MHWQAGWLAAATEVATLERAVAGMSSIVLVVVGGVAVLGAVAAAVVTVRRVRDRP